MSSSSTQITDKTQEESQQEEPPQQDRKKPPVATPTPEDKTDPGSTTMEEESFWWLNDCPSVLEGHTSINTPLKQVDAYYYLVKVKSEFQDDPKNPHTYDLFLDIMRWTKYKAKQINTPSIIVQVSQLFCGHNDLILGFNPLLPPRFWLCSEILMMSDTRFWRKGEDPNEDRLAGMEMSRLHHLCKKYGLSKEGSKKEVMQKLESVRIPNEDGNSILYSRLIIRKTTDPKIIKCLSAPCMRGCVKISTRIGSGTKVGFIHSVGFLYIGEREIIVRGIHTSLIGIVSAAIESLFEQVKHGKPLLEGQMVQHEDIVYQVRYPNKYETAELQSYEMSLISILHGPENYEVIDLVPVYAAKVGSGGAVKLPSSDGAVIHSPSGSITYNGRSRPPDSTDWSKPAHFGKIRACGWCGHLETFTEIVKLRNCGRCKIACYCSSTCQREAWPGHKIDCRQNVRHTNLTSIQKKKNAKLTEKSYRKLRKGRDSELNQQRKGKGLRTQNGIFTQDADGNMVEMNEDGLRGILAQMSNVPEASVSRREMDELRAELTKVALR